MDNGYKDFQWFGFFIHKGSYNIEFEIKSNNFINQHYNCGIKLHQPFNYIISNFLNNIDNNYQKVSIPIINNYDQNIIFIFDDYLKKINIDIKNIKINNNQIIKNNKKNIILVLFKDNNNLINNINNIKSHIIDIFDKIYNVYIISIIVNNKKNEKIILENINPHFIYHTNHVNVNNIIFFTNKFINQMDILYDFIFITNLDILYLQYISNINIIINKINFLSYKDNNNNIDLDYNLLIIPFQYFNKLNNINDKNIIDFLYENHINYHLLLNDFYYKNDYLILNDIKTTFINNGFLFETNFIKNILYYNNYCYFKKINDNHFYFFKNITQKYQEFLWCGYNLKFSKESNENIVIKVKFNIKINSKFDLNNKIGLKTHNPLKIHNDFFKNINLKQYTKIEFNINIKKKNQLIIFNFDDYLDEIEFEIKDFKLIYNID